MTVMYGYRAHQIGHGMQVQHRIDWVFGLKTINKSISGHNALHMIYILRNDQC
jgi:hypothetical protein